jgi:hypothetical protein
VNDALADHVAGRRRDRHVTCIDLAGSNAVVCDGQTGTSSPAAGEIVT